LKFAFSDVFSSGIETRRDSSDFCTILHVPASTTETDGKHPSAHILQRSVPM
jgi:hypothetical protein